MSLLLSVHSEGVAGVVALDGSTVLAFTQENRENIARFPKAA